MTKALAKMVYERHLKSIGQLELDESPTSVFVGNLSRPSRGTVQVEPSRYSRDARKVSRLASALQQSINDLFSFQHVQTHI